MKLWPSGGIAAENSMPTIEPAPARFSITTVWPSRLPRSAPSSRATMSVLPPGAQGTTMRSGLSGQAAALQPMAGDSRVVATIIEAGMPARTDNAFITSPGEGCRVWSAGDAGADQACSTGCRFVQPVAAS